MPADPQLQRSVIQWRRGAGAVCVFSRGRRLIGSIFSAHFASWLVTLWRHRTAAEVARRRTLPQRHRLLQGYPMAPQLRKDLDEDLLAHLEDWLGLDARKPCVVGVLPVVAPARHRLSDDEALDASVHGSMG